MNTDLSQTTTSLILSHLYNVRYEARFSAMQKSIESLLESIGNPKIKPNDPIVIARILRGGLNIISLLGNFRTLCTDENRSKILFNGMLDSISDRVYMYLSFRRT